MTRYAVRAGWRPGRATSAIFVAATLAACHRSTPSATHATPPATSAAHEAPLAWKSTAELVRDPELRALVDELAQKKRVEGHAVGEAGAPSEIFALYTRAVKKASHGDRVALVSHLSPVVRVYFAESLLGETPPSIDAIYPLFRDDTEVETLDGCLGEDGIVSTAILRMAWTLPRETRAALVTRVARDASLPGTARAYALRDLANEGGDDVRPIALSAIGSAEPLGPAALHALAEAAEPEDVDRIVPFASSPSPHVRAGAAHALGASCDVKAVRALEPLLADPDPDVKRLAVKSYVVQTAADPARVAKLLADDDRWFREAALAGVAKRPDGSGLALLEPALMSDDPPSEDVMSDLFSEASPARTTTARKMLGAKSERARIAAIHYLDHADDRTSAKTIERSLSAPANVLEQSEAAATLSRWGDRDAIPLLQKLLVDPNPNTRIAGAKALVLLHAKESEKALARAAASDGSFAKPELERALAAVRRGDTDAGL